MPKISAAATPSVKTIDLEAQAKSANSNKINSTGRTPFKRTLFAVCNFGLACCLIQAVRSQNPIAHQAMARHLQANNASSIATSDPSTVAVEPTPEPQIEPEACPKGYDRFKKNPMLKNFKTALLISSASTGGSLLLAVASKALPNNGNLQAIAMTSCIAICTLSTFAFSTTTMATVILAVKKDGKCYKRVGDPFVGYRQLET